LPFLLRERILVAVAGPDAGGTKGLAHGHPRPAYPRPRFVRPDWLCLNGPWQFEIDFADTGLALTAGFRPHTIAATGGKEGWP
jgi:hypothetical protein